MKLLLIQSRGKHSQNHDFRECLNIQRAMTRQFPDVEVEIWGKGWDTQLDLDVDVILLLENYPTGWLPYLGNSRALKLFWSVDSHCVLDEHIQLCKDHGIHVVLNSNKCDIKHFKNSYSFPNAYPADLIYPLVDRNTKDVGFCGNIISNRSKMINKLDIYPHIMVLGDDMVKVVNSYKIHWNCNLSYDINYRTFETLGCRTMLLTNETDNLSDLFEIGTDLVTYTSVGDCKEKINYLNHADEREKIAEVGWVHAVTHHTFDNRVHLLMDIIKSGI